MTKEISTLVEDIYSLLDPDNDHECNEQNLDKLAENVKELFRTRLKKYTPSESPLRFSSIGKKDRQIWYQAHPDPDNPPEPMLPKTYMKFLYGDLVEIMLLFLAKEAGHSVENEQGEVECNGVKGHIDAIIDGHVVDVKSASPYGYKKFEQGSVEQDDPFGYVHQLAGYASILTPGKPAYWLASNKVGGDICTTQLNTPVIRHYQPEERIEHLKEVIASETPPKRCYEDAPDGKSGNRKLGTGCSYCSYKFRCWDNLRGFAYSSGPRYLTQVERVPDVPEFTI